MAEMGDVFPRPNLGAGDIWARQVMERIEGLERGITGTVSTLRSVQAGTTSALSSVVQNAPIIEKIERDQFETMAEVEVKGRVFAQPEMPLPPDPRSMWIDTDDENLAYRGVEIEIDPDLESGVWPFPNGSQANWEIVPGAGRGDSPAFVHVTNNSSNAWGEETWDRKNHINYDMWVQFPVTSEKVRLGAAFNPAGAGLIQAYMDTSSSGEGTDATLQINAQGEVTGASPFVVQSGVWYNLQVAMTDTHLSISVYDGSDTLLGSYSRGYVGSQIGGAGIHGNAVNAGSGGIISDFRARTAEWEAMPNAASDTAEQALADAQQAINDAAEAQATADGKNAIYSGTSEPGGTDYKQGDLFLEQDGSGDVIAVKVWNGTAWAERTLLADQVLVPSSIGAISIGDGAVTTPKLFAGAITADKIAVDAIVSDKIAAGAIFGEHIAAGTISANKLVLSDTSNLIPDAGFNSPLSDGPWSLHGYPWSVFYDSTPEEKGVRLDSGFDGSAALLTSGAFAVKSGDSLFVRANVYNDTDANTILRVRWFDNAGGAVSTDNVGDSGAGAASWAELSGSLTVPAGAVSAWVQILCQGPTSASTSLQAVGFQVLRKASAELIVDGAITADKLSVNAIDGMTITGATLQTSTSGARFEIRSFPDGQTGVLYGYDSDGERRVHMFPGTTSQTTPFLEFSQKGKSGGTTVTSSGIRTLHDGSFYTYGGIVDTDQGVRMIARNGSSSSQTSASVASVIASVNGSSLRALKREIRVHDSPSLLDLPYRSWADVQPDPLGLPPLPEGVRRVGAIAEEMRDLAPELCTYDDDGNLLGIAYDRVAVALIPILRDLVNRVETLEGKQPTVWAESPEYDDSDITTEITAKGSEPLREPLKQGSEGDELRPTHI